jgi:hypothetical protein
MHYAKVAKEMKSAKKRLSPGIPFFQAFAVFAAFA